MSTNRGERWMAELRSEVRGLAAGPGRRDEAGSRVSGAGLALVVLQRLEGLLAAAHEEVLTDVRELRGRWALHWARLDECRGALAAVLGEISDPEARTMVMEVLARTATDDYPSADEVREAKAELWAKSSEKGKPRSGATAASSEAVAAVERSSDDER